jgi:hypothetical protein
MSTEPSLTDGDIMAITAKVRSHANKLRDDASYTGAWSDNGASDLEAKLEAWLSGLKREVPLVFKEFYASVKRDNDPEYAEFLRLKRKFG